MCLLRCFSHVLLFATPGTVAHQAPLSMGSPGKNTGVGCHALLQGIFPTQRLNLGLLHLLFSLPLSHWERSAHLVDYRIETNNFYMHWETNTFM